MSIDDVNFGQKWSEVKNERQKWKAKAHHGLHGNQWVKVELQISKTILVKKSCSNYMDTSDIEFV